MKNFIFLSSFLVLLSCSESTSQKPMLTVEENFNPYWYAGTAEITSYELAQARYGEIHRGSAVVVFVTEPFSQKKQVKLDNWKDTSDDNVSVLKMNMTKKFLTGIYPYSMMMSTFKPVSFDKFPNALKITTSLQEWCGHTWLQLNKENKGYGLSGFSYFESEGDLTKSIPSVILEDELWSSIRLNPKSLPIGDVMLFPGTYYLRLKHRPLEAKKAEAMLQEIEASKFSKTPHSRYEISYQDRSLTIYFENDFPYSILGWEESYKNGLTTTAKKINTIKSAYWGKNSNSDRAIREKLGLETK